MTADPATCSFQFNPVGTSKFTSSCDIAKSALAKGGTPYLQRRGLAGTVATIKVGRRRSTSFEATRPADAATVKANQADFGKQPSEAAQGGGLSCQADPAQTNEFMLLVILHHPV